MSVTELAPMRERRRLYARVEQMQRATAAIHLTVDDLPILDQLLVLNEVLREKLDVARATDVLPE